MSEAKSVAEGWDPLMAKVSRANPIEDGMPVELVYFRHLNIYLHVTHRTKPALHGIFNLQIKR
ncbi:hypothetical protein ACO0LM_14000 [Undibacterium sp. Di26W]|uniref:hypothetical protein n=1 Tax=Undibacterium sp. Di26W TaxID=3413035 RepID=UPI003BEFF84F